MGWERDMGMHGYRGSGLEEDDRSAGIKVGGTVRLKADNTIPGTIEMIEIDVAGNPWFTVCFGVGKAVQAAREDVIAA